METKGHEMCNLNIREGMLLLLFFFSLSSFLFGFDDQGIVNNIHDKYKGEIVWSDEKIDLNNPNESTFKKTFTTDDWLYGRMYLPQSMQNSIYEETGVKYDKFYFYFDVYINGKLQDWQLPGGDFNGNLVERTTQQLWIYTPLGCDDLAGWFDLIKNLPGGNNNIRFDLRAKISSGQIFDTVYATGTFTFNKRNGETPGYGTPFDVYKSGMNDPDLEAKILTSIGNYAYNQDWDESFYNVKILSDKWQIVRERGTGNVIKKYVIAYCFAMWPDRSFSVQQFQFSTFANGSFQFDGVISGTQEKIKLD